VSFPSLPILTLQFHLSNPFRASLSFSLHPTLSLTTSVSLISSCLGTILRHDNSRILILSVCEISIDLRLQANRIKEFLRLNIEWKRSSNFVCPFCTHLFCFFLFVSLLSILLYFKINPCVSILTSTVVVDGTARSGWASK
jgi:hypothetical protein